MGVISPDLAQKTGCFIKGKLLCYFRYSALVTYFSTLPSASLSMPSVLSLYKTPKGDAAKTSFATSPYLWSAVLENLCKSSALSLSYREVWEITSYRPCHPYREHPWAFREYLPSCRRLRIPW